MPNPLFSNPGGPTAVVYSVAFDAAVTQLANAVATVCPGAAAGSAASYIVGVVNNSLSAQTVTVAIYDSNTGATGNVVASIGPLGISQVITFPGPGIRLQNGATALASGTPIAPGIQILTR